MKILNFAITYSGLSLLDIWTTLKGVSLGHTEFNPVVRYVLDNYSTPVFILLHMASVIILCLLAQTAKERNASKWMLNGMLYFLIISKVLIVINNLKVIY